MINMLSLGSRLARAPAAGHAFRYTDRVLLIPKSPKSPGTCRHHHHHHHHQQQALRTIARDFSSRGSRHHPRHHYPRHSSRQQRQQERNRKAAQGSAAVCGATVLGGVMIWQANQDEAPYTHRRRFMVVSRDGEFMRGMSKTNWDSVKQQYRPKILPRTHQATRTVERVGKRIAEASGLKGCQWEFIVVREDTMNAFVLPGGKVVVFTGLLGATPNEDALASVLGHEVGHVVANHAGEKLSKNFLKEGLLLLLFALTGFEYFDVVRSIGSLVFDLPNSREMEREADFIGLQLMAKACFDPNEMPKTFGRMEAISKKKGVAKGPAYLSTHPADDERIAKQKEWMYSAIETYDKSGCRNLRDWRESF